MPSMQIVFLFDLNAYVKDNLKSDPDLNRKLLCLRLTCLKILTHYYTIEPNLKWGFKFFDSRGSLTQKMCNFTFPCVSLESYEILENEINIRYQRHLTYLDALSVSADKNNATYEKPLQSDESKKQSFYSVQVLQHALTQILGEYQWSSEMTLFSPSKKNYIYNKMKKNDILFLITKCPETEQEFFEYFGTDYSSITTTKFSKSLLTRSLNEKLLIKSSILWIWLNTNTENFLGEISMGLLSKIAELLKSLKCSLVPISIYSPTPCILKFEENESQLLKVNSLNSLAPFSTIFSQSVNYPFYMDIDVSSRYSTIQYEDIELFVSLVKILFHSKGKNELLQKETQEHSNKDSFRSSSLAWTKFVAHFAVNKKPCLQACDTILCVPSVSFEESNFKLFQNFNKTLISRDINLFVVCESTCGLLLPGLYSPLSDTSAFILILDPAIFCKNIECFSSINKEINESVITTCEKIDKISGNPVPNSCHKPFQIECLEQWFEPVNTVCNVSSICQDSENNILQLKPFYKKLSSKILKAKKTSPVKETTDPETKDCMAEEIPDLLKVSGLNENELKTMLISEYNSSLESNHSLLQTAKRIVKSGLAFYQQNSYDTHNIEDLFRKLMNECFFHDNKIMEVNNESKESDKKIEEYQLQVLLAFEIEIIFPCFEKSNLIDKVTSFLRRMSFFSNPSELNIFLHETLKENYKETLYDILVSIGEELDIPLFEEEDSPYEPSEPPSSESMLGSNTSLQSSAFSVKSSSSSSSRADTRKIKKRSDIVNNNKSRQFLLTRSSPKKKKYKNLYPGGENSIPIRYSPRLSSKRKRERKQNQQINPGNARRNLFPKDHKLMTPKYRSPRAKKKLGTPKAHHVLKTHFVAETPISKQNQSALQRRKSFMDTDNSDNSLTEIAESPNVAKNYKGATQKDLLKRFNSLESTSSSQPEPQPVPSCSSYLQYTPDKKRRLSLQLFCNLQNSPTARKGLRKCSKRLFDQISPQKDNTQNKRRRFDSITEVENLETFSQSGNDQKQSDGES